MRSFSSPCVYDTILTLRFPSVVTGAGDETLRFWNAFPKGKAFKRTDGSVLNTFTQIR